LFDLRTFLSVGGYDEAFSHNEDAELDYRLTKAGGNIWMCSDGVAIYYPRSSPWALAKQYFLHGWGRAQMLFKHKARPRLRQLLPIAVLFLCLFGAIGSLFSPVALIGPLIYIFSCLSWGCLLALRSRDACAAGSGVAAIIMHLCWALGLIAFLYHITRLKITQWLEAGTGREAAAR
jgi:succinoglycan biosynthesis protein ExoA